MLFWTSSGTCVLVTLLAGTLHRPASLDFFYTVFQSGYTSLLCFTIKVWLCQFSTFTHFYKLNIVSLFPSNYCGVTLVCVKYLVNSWLLCHDTTLTSLWLHLLLIYLLGNLSYWCIEVCIHSGYQPFVGYMGCRYSLYCFFPSFGKQVLYLK